MTTPENLGRGMSDIGVLLQDAGGLWVIAVLCGLSVLLTVLWLLAVMEYTHRAEMSSTRLHAKSRVAC